jgi:hypothetical protein
VSSAGFKSLRDLIKDLETIEGLTPYAKARASLQAAEVLRIAFAALREIAWLPDAKTQAANNLKKAKCDAMVALKKCKASAEDFTPKPGLPTTRDFALEMEGENDAGR